MLAILRKKMIEYIRANIAAYFFIILIFIIGIVVGALAVKTLSSDAKAELLGYLKIFFQNLLQGQDTLGDTTVILTNAILVNAKVICLMWFLGFTVVGIPFILFMVWMKGFIIGFTVGFLVNEYIMKGVLFAIASVLPHNFFAVPAVLATAVTAISFSLMLVQKNSKTKESLLYKSIVYSVFCLIMLAVSILAAMVEVYLSPVFMRMGAGMFI